MTDPDLTPEQEAVRRLLADARHDEPTPPEVVARLDEQLAALVDARATTPLVTERPPAPVVDLGARRRRAVGIGLLAAAAVVVAGVGIGQVLPSGSGDSGGSTSADSGSADRELADQPAEGGSDAGGSADSELAPESQKSVTPFASSPTVSADDPQLEDELLAARSTAPLSSDASGAPAPGTACDLPALGRGRQVAAEVDGQPGIIVFRRPSGAAQQVELYVCGTPEPVRTLTLLAP
ncbi:hypothetical protein SAMN04489844_1530 [Nocardioides exalbidus]|uniref:Uncharacterized protein n=1 Tax=Nocardioides exalbidus TaxID=402596 RepID=A0A1H4P5A4_9ACTN|nr:hypothetical protein [Nocardioides exalbidus]SEC02549.1 hypothetical protein SAMN04489844_1530 [Nocardioides exalbidus]